MLLHVLGYFFSNYLQTVYQRHGDIIWLVGKPCFNVYRVRLRAKNSRPYLMNATGVMLLVGQSNI
jgi:hypothetical protein